MATWSSPAWATFPGRNGTIAFCARFSGEPRGLFRIDPDGGGLARVVPKASWEDIAPAWSPDGTTLAFVSDRTGDRDVWTVVPGSGVPAVNLTETPSLDEWLPTWSPDGRIAFVVQGGAAGDTVDVIDAGGGRVTIAAPGVRIYGVEWSPLGGRVVFGVQDGAGVAIDAVRADGSGVQRWAGSLPHAVVYDWRPDGRWVLFQGDASGRRALFEIAVGGAHRIRRLTSPGPTDADQHGSYSPNGAKVAFVRTTSAGDGLWLVRADGTHQRMLRALYRMRLFGVTWQAR